MPLHDKASSPKAPGTFFPDDHLRMIAEELKKFPREMTKNKLPVEVITIPSQAIDQVALQLEDLAAEVENCRG